MNWGGFPIGMRFPVSDYSEATKARCWQHVFDAVSYSYWEDIFFHESTEIDEMSGQLLYNAIVASHCVDTARKNGILWRNDPALRSSLFPYRPFIQENYIELHTPSVLIGFLNYDGTICSENGISYLPQYISRKKTISKNKRGILIWPFEKTISNSKSFSTTLLTISKEYPDYSIKVLFYGKDENVLTAIASNQGNRYSHLKIHLSEERIYTFQYCLLPPNSLLIRTASNDKLSKEDILFILNMISNWHHEKIYWVSSCLPHRDFFEDKVELINDIQALNLNIAMYSGADTIFYSESLPIGISLTAPNKINMRK